ncbi:hypothetical protein [Ralstonia pseudosolanacearum]|uniref:hypothetical protein n=1 Tax=Ralstonia pseudosolanacearum TaxID=1310165 RepID=UPI0039C755A8
MRLGRNKQVIDVFAILYRAYPNKQAGLHSDEVLASGVGDESGDRSRLESREEGPRSRASGLAQKVVSEPLNKLTNLGGLGGSGLQNTEPGHVQSCSRWSGLAEGGIAAYDGFWPILSH